MTANLRPMTLGEILDRTFQIYRSRFFALVGIAALPALTLAGLQTVNFVWWHIYPEPWTRPVFLGLSSPDLLYLVVLYQISLLFRIFAWPALAHTASLSYLGQSSASPGALSLCASRWQSWVWLSLSTWGLLMLLPELVGSGLLIGTLYIAFEVLKLDPSPGGPLGPGFFFEMVGLCWIASLWLGAAYCFVAPAWMSEGLNVRRALKRARILSKGSRLRIFFAWLLPAVVSSILGLALERLLALMRSACFVPRMVLPLHLKVIVIQFSSGWCFPMSVVETIRLVASTAIATLIAPLFPIALTLIYYDQRIRHEGFDIEMMMSAAGMNAPVSAAPVASPDAADMPQADAPVAAAEPEERPA